MPLDVGRVSHLTDQMHRSEDDAGDPIDDGFLLAADGARGHTWVDPATFGGGALDVTDGSTTATAVDTIEFAATGDASVTVAESPAGTALVTIDATGTGGGSTRADFVQSKYQGVNGSSLTMDLTPLAGSRILLGINRLGTSTTSSVTQTNVTWTMLLQYVTGGSCLELWVGVCASSPSATINYTAGSSDYNSVRAIEISSPALTPTAGQTYAAATNGGTLTGMTPGNYVVGMTTNVNTGIAATSSPQPPLGGPGVGYGSIAVIVPLWIAYAAGSAMVVDGVNGSATLLAEVS